MCSEASEPRGTPSARGAAGARLSRRSGLLIVERNQGAAKRLDLLLDHAQAILQLDADVWGLIDKFPDIYALILSNTQDDAVEITGSGLRAMRDLEALNPHPGIATNAMCTFLAINMASVQLIPTTAIAILVAAGLPGLPVNAQRGAAPTNDLPNPYQSVEGAFTLPGGRLTLNARATDGEIRVRTLDAEGRALPGSGLRPASISWISRPKLLTTTCFHPLSPFSSRARIAAAGYRRSTVVCSRSA